MVDPPEPSHYKTAVPAEAAMILLRTGAIGLVLIVFLLLSVPASFAGPLGARLRDFLAPLFCRALCRLLQIEVRQDRAPGREPALLVANHVSWLDVIVLGRESSLCFLAKAEVASWPVLGRLARAQGCVFIDRSRRMTIPSVNRQIADRLREGRSVVLFPEATTSDGTRIQRFHAPHFQAAEDAMALDPGLETVAIQPLAICYARQNGLPLGRRGRSKFAWYGDMTFWPSFVALVTSGPIRCELARGAALTFRRGDDRKRVARATERTIRALMSLSVSGRTSSPSQLSEIASGRSPPLTAVRAMRTVSS